MQRRQKSLQLGLDILA